MLFDTHMHTKFSTDSKMTIEEVLQQVHTLKIGAIITEHMDLKYPEGEGFTFDVDDFFHAYHPYRSDRVLLGVEIGMRQDCLGDNQQMVKQYPFDFVIGSIHIVDDMDIYHEAFYNTRTKQETYQQYFEAMRCCMNCYDCMDSLGHLDYIARYARYQDTEIYYTDFCEQIDEVLRLVAYKEKALEINTRRLNDKQSLEALVPIYKRFFELGGRLVTIGSDAHKPQDIGKNIRLATDLAEHCRLKPVYYKERSPYYVD